MFLRHQLRRTTALQWHRVLRYSTISIQGTVSKTQHIPLTSSINTPTSTSTSAPVPLSDSTSPHSSTENNDPLAHLQQAQSLFANEHGLFNKIQILTQQLKDPDTPTRIGLIGSKQSLLNTILADPFASDQQWYQEFTQRPTSENHLVKFSQAFETSNNEYNVPSPYLEPHLNNYEFLELNDHSVNLDASDGCHLYISFLDTAPQSISKWPVYNITDVDTTNDIHDVVLTNDEISSQVSFQAVKLLTESPQNATIYTQLQSKSNISKFLTRLNRISDSDVVIPKLYNSVLKNLAEQNQKHSLTLVELHNRDSKIRKYIANWDEASHREFQSKFKPYVTEYEQRELPWWKLYYRVDDVQEILAQMLHQGLLNDSFKNYSYVKGQIDSFTSFQTDNVKNFEETLAELDQNELTNLKRRIIQSDLVVLQNRAVKLLMTNFIGVQLPLLLVSIPGYIIYDFSMYSMAGLASLGAVVGFNNISNQWLKLVSSFKQELFEKVRLGLLEVNRGLYADWGVKYEIEKAQITKRHDLIEALKSDLGL